MTMPELCVSGCQDRRNTGDMIADALDALPPDRRHILFRCIDLTAPEPKGLGLKLNVDHARRYFQSMIVRDYCYLTQTGALNVRPRTYLWGHPDAIRIARERGY